MYADFNVPFCQHGIYVTDLAVHAKFDWGTPDGDDLNQVYVHSVYLYTDIAFMDGKTKAMSNYAPVDVYMRSVIRAWFESGAGVKALTETVVRLMTEYESGEAVKLRLDAARTI